MDQVIERLKLKKPPIKADGIEEIKNRLSLASEKDHFQELRAIGDRIQKELARIDNLVSELQRQNPGQDYPFLSRASEIPGKVIPQK
jgi:hypothetical protein